MALGYSATPADVRKINSAIQQASSFANITVKMGAIDTQFNMVEPIVEALGWDRNNPAIVQRAPTDNITMLLSSDEAPPIAITTIKQGGHIGKTKAKDAAMKEATSRGIHWLVITNGHEWWIMNRSDSNVPFRKFDITVDNAAQNLALLSRRSVEGGSLQRSHELESQDNEVKAALREILASKELSEMLRKKMAKKKIKTTTEAISASLDRMALYNALDKSDQGISTPRTQGEKKSRSLQTSTSSPKSTPTNQASKSEPDRQKNSAPSKTPDWVEGATHKMIRKKNVAFMRLDEETGRATLLPKSIIAFTEGKTIPKPLKNMRYIARQDGSIVKSGSMLKVTREITLDSAKSAASFAAGTIVPNLSCWEDQDGNELTVGKKPIKPAGKDTTTSTEAVQPQAKKSSAKRSSGKKKPVGKKSAQKTKATVAPKDSKSAADKAYEDAQKVEAQNDSTISEKSDQASSTEEASQDTIA